MENRIGGKVQWSAIIIISVSVCIVLAFLVMGIIIGTRGKEITRLNELLTDIKLQTEIDINEARMEAERVKKQLEIEIENMPASAVVIRFLDADEIISSTTFKDAIAREIVNHSIKFFSEMGIHFTTIDRRNVE